ncbi:MAG: hypothetical protein U0Y82_00220 [Thermoleophilia bacterium]
MGPFKQRGRQNAGAGDTIFGLPVIPDPDHLMSYEFARARRYERPIAVMALAADQLPDDGDLRLRFSDMVTVDVRRGAVVALMPETDGTDLAGALRRVRAALPVGATVGGAAFPDDALTLANLVDVALERCGIGIAATEAA